MVSAIIITEEQDNDLFQDILNRQLNVLYSSLQSDNVKGLEQMIDQWYRHYQSKYDELESSLELERVIRQLFLFGANFASAKCLEYLHSCYPRPQEDLNSALCLVCNLAITRKEREPMYYSTTEIFTTRVGQRKKEQQYKIVQWLVSLGADLYYESSLEEEDNVSIEQRKYFSNIVQTLLWYHNTELLNQLCFDGLEISEEDIAFLLMMLDHQEQFPFIEENFVCICKFITSKQRYRLLLDMASRGEYFLMKTFYLYIEDSYKNPLLYVELFHRCPSYITRQWVVETIGIDHTTFNGWLRMYDAKISESKKRKINFLYEIYQKEAKWQ